MASLLRSFFSLHTSKLCGPWLTAAILSAAFCGCANWRLRDEGFKDNDLSKSARQVRPKSKESDDGRQYMGLSKKGRQIERDLNSL